MSRKPAWRLKVPDRDYELTDRCCGILRQNLTRECGDFLVRRADGVYMYQLAVVVDDGLSGVTEVVRGRDLLESAPRQMYLQELLGFGHPQYAHVPMLMSIDGRRLSKRDKDLDLGQLRSWMKPEQLLGWLAHAAGLLEEPEAVSARELATIFAWERVKKEDIFVDTNCFRR